MRGKTVVVVPTGTANLASVLAGLERAGGRPVVAREYADISEAPRLVLPGVGSFGAAVSKLRSSGAWNAIARYLNKGRPTLAICLGLQLLCTGSEESPGIEGFGFFDAHVGRFPRGLRVPHMGWNTVEPDGGCVLVRPGMAYFANSYHIDRAPSDAACAWTRHGKRFVGAVEKGNILACQFHPELSGAWGRELISRWLAC